MIKIGNVIFTDGHTEEIIRLFIEDNNIIFLTTSGFYKYETLIERIGGYLVKKYLCYKFPNNAALVISPDDTRWEAATGISQILLFDQKSSPLLKTDNRAYPDYAWLFGRFTRVN